ncbi:hypothetical protein L6452_01440 [Arctium lappa]|uniref:Uncharacterized protein n=1 Tax=Arctium lappa TaxID=4217 RepID=A0ACB9FGM6_ARCLA|nr:hypothetical protein L6452_01440 [Arctium lappa]
MKKRKKKRKDKEKKKKEKEVLGVSGKRREYLLDSLMITLRYYVIAVAISELVQKEEQSLMLIHCLCGGINR